MDGRVVWAEGFGLADVDAAEAITPSTVFDIGSTSKQFTATALLLLAQDGALDLDAPLAQYLPQLPGWAERPTLRQMMHHQSGIPDYIHLLTERGFTLAGSSTDEDAMAALADVRDLDFAPGTQFSYSNSNYFLFSQIVEAVDGRSLPTYLRDEVFEPLELNAVMEPTASIPPKAISYYSNGGDWVVADSLWEQTGDGGIQTTPSELARWGSQYWNPSIGGAATLAARTEGAVANGRTKYGAGINITTRGDGGPLFLHSGGWAGFVSDLLVLPDEKIAIAVTCNRPDGESPTDLALGIMNALGVSP